MINIVQIIHQCVRLIEKCVTHLCWMVLPWAVALDIDNESFSASREIRFIISPGITIEVYGIKRLILSLSNSCLYLHIWTKLIADICLYLSCEQERYSNIVPRSNMISIIEYFFNRRLSSGNWFYGKKWMRRWMSRWRTGGTTWTGSFLQKRCSSFNKNMHDKQKYFSRLTQVGRMHLTKLLRSNSS